MNPATLWINHFDMALGPGITRMAFNEVIPGGSTEPRLAILMTTDDAVEMAKRILDLKAQLDEKETPS